MKKILPILLLLPAMVWADSFKHDNDTDIEDTFIKSGPNADNNYGTSSLNYIYANAANDHFLIRFANLNDSIGAGQTIDSAFLYTMITQDAGSNKTYRVYGMWNNEWVENDTGSSEGGATYNDWISPDSEWTTAGAECAYDAGNFDNYDDAGCDADSADRQSTYLCEVLVHADSVAYDTFKNDVGAWVDTCYQHSEDPAFIFKMVTTSNALYIGTREQGSAAAKPYMVVWYSAEGEATTKLWKVLK